MQKFNFSDVTEIEDAAVICTGSGRLLLGPPGDLEIKDSVNTSQQNFNIYSTAFKLLEERT